MTDTSEPLVHRYRGIVCDLDGVVYRSHQPVDFAVESLTAASRLGCRIVYATNNASRTPGQVAAQLSGLGLALQDADVVTSAQAGARRMRELVGNGGRILAVGGEGVRQALCEEGLVPVTVAEGALGVLQGYGPDVSWRELAEAAYAVQAGACWVATNVDGTLPTDRGTAPGNGTLVAAVQRAVEVMPVVVGKPETPLYDLSAEVLGTESARTLAVGDRLDTDIAGANAAGFDALHVLTGVHGVLDLANAPRPARPRYVSADLRGLHRSYEEPRPEGEAWVCGTARVRVDVTVGAVEVLSGDLGEEALRAALAAWWHAVETGAAADQARHRSWHELAAAVGRQETADPPGQ